MIMDMMVPAARELLAREAERLTRGRPEMAAVRTLLIRAGWPEQDAMAGIQVAIGLTMLVTKNVRGDEKWFQELAAAKSLAQYEAEVEAQWRDAGQS